MNLIDLLFTIAAFGFTSSILPQIILIYKTKDVGGISLLRNYIMFTALEITIVACILSNLIFSTIMNTVQLVLMVIIIIMVLVYKKKIKNQ